MEPFQIAILLLAGAAVGWINNIAGAAGAIGLIVFQKLLGMPLMEANACLRPAALGIGLGGFIGFATRKQRIPPKMWAYALLTVPGAIAGSLLVKPRFSLLFQLTLIVLLSLVLVQQLRNRAGGTRTGDGKPEQESPPWLLFLAFSWLGAHMGFIQVATGLVAIFVLSAVHSRELVAVNAAKMAFVTVSAITSNITLACTTEIRWGPALTLAGGAAAGSFLASRWSVDKGHGAVRAFIIVICVAVLLYLTSGLIGGGA